MLSAKVFWAALLGFAACLTCIFGDLPNKQPYARGLGNRTAVLYANEIKGSNAKGQDYDLQRKKGEADLKLAGGSKSYDTSAANGRASATGAGGKTATGTLVGSGGTYETPRNKGNYRTSQQGTSKVVDLDSNGVSKLNVQDINKEKNFVATGNRHSWGTDPDDNNYKNGVLTNDKKPYNYQIDKTSDGKATAQLSDPSSKNFLLPNGKVYKCTSQSDSITNCVNQNGLKVGEVRGSKTGNVVVSNSLGIPLYSANVTHDSSGKKKALVNNGLFSAESAKQVDSNCPGFTNDKVKLSKKITFSMPGQQTSDGGTRRVWPSCFDASIDITLGPGVLGKNMAFKWVPLVLPAGRLNCQDPATVACGSAAGECYYCDMCDPVKRAKVTIMGNAASNICEARGGQTFTATSTVCPPPEADMKNYCDHFSKGLGDPYWKKQGNLDVTFQVFERKDDTDFANVKKDPKQYASLVADYRKANPLILAFTIPDATLSNWYKQNKAEMIGCRRSVVNYNMGGGSSASLLLDAAALTSASRNPCPAPRK